MIYYFFLHFLADFILQSREMGKKKSSELKWLGLHIGIIFSVFLVGTLDIEFAFWNAIIHMCIDAVIWKGYKSIVWHKYTGDFWPKDKKEKVRGLIKQISQKHKYWEDSWFYTTIGFDQFLHAATIIFLLEYL